MAKKAGLKNDGKWARVNKALSTLNSTEKASLVDTISTLATANSAFDAYRALVEEAGLSDDAEFPTTKTEFVENIVNDGIPRQLYMGRLSYDTYTKIGTKYVADHGAEIHAFGVELRDALSTFLVMRRQARDLANVGTRAEGNPGGDPDGDPET